MRPLLKKHGLDASDKKNYRPVSNLPFLSKLLERVAQSRLQQFLDGSGLMPRSQSAYRQFHSTETVVMRVYNNMLLAADGGQVSVLCLLDLFAAFDTVDHDLLTLRLERQFGLRGAVLQWFRSYLSTKSYMEMRRLQLSASCVPYHKAQYLVRDCSFSTPRTSRNTLRNTASTTTRLLTTLSCTCTVVTMTHHLPSYDWRTASRKSATGCPPTV